MASKSLKTHIQYTYSVEYTGDVHLGKELEELEKDFILSDDMEREDIKELISRILKMCKIDAQGYVAIRKPDLTIAQRIMLVLSARYLANKLQHKLSRESPIDETCKTMDIANMLKEKDTVIRVRLKELKDAKKVLSSKRGVFKIAPYEIKDFLAELEGAEN